MEHLQEVKLFALDNLKRAATPMHISQREHLRQAYRRIPLATTITSIIDILESEACSAPYERAINRNWPNQKYSLTSIAQETTAYAYGFSYDWFCGYPNSTAYEESWLYEEQERSKDCFYNIGMQTGW